MKRLMLLAVLGALLVGGCGGATGDEYAGMVRNPAPQVGGVTLPDAARNDQATPLRAQPGGVMLVFFGFTHCPDICPTTMADIRAAIRRLPAADQQRVQVAMITVDPERDDTQGFARYVQSFIPDGIALRTDDTAQLQRAVDALGASYEITRGDNGEPQVSHTALVYLVDSNGEVPVQWAFGTSAQTLSDDIKLALDKETT